MWLLVLVCLFLILFVTCLKTTSAYKMDYPRTNGPIRKQNIVATVLDVDHCTHPPFVLHLMVIFNTENLAFQQANGEKVL